MTSNQVLFSLRHGLAVLVVSLGIMLPGPIGCSGEKPGRKPAAGSDDSARRPEDSVAQRHVRPPIGIALHALRESFRVRPYFFEFSRMADVDGYPNYFGRTRVLPEALIQTIGDTNNLSTVALIATVKPDTSWRLATFATATRLAATIDANMSEWANRGAEGVLLKKSTYVDTTVGDRHWSLVTSQYADHARISLRVRSVRDTAGRTRR